MAITNWDQLPILIRLSQLAELYDLNETTVRKKVESGDPSIPLPAFLHPYRWRKADVIRHLEKHSIVEQLRTKARRALSQVG
jgi:hypothetical protein